MKILLLYETVYPDFIGGVETRNHELAAALCRRGHEVTLAGFCTGLVGGPPGPRILSLGDLGKLYNASGKRSTRQAIRFAAAVARLDLSSYDVVETANMPYIHLFPLAVRCALARKPLVVTWYEYWGAYWTGYVGQVKAPVYRAIEWMTAQLGGAVTATSRLTAERVAARRWRGRGGVRLVPCGIDVDRVRRAAGESGGWAAGGAQTRPPGLPPTLPGGSDSCAPSSLHPPDPPAVPGPVGPPLVFAGRLLEHKRLEVLLRAVAILAERAPDGVLLTIFGEGPDRERLEGIAAELGLGERVAFRGYVATSDEVWAELGRSLIAVQPSAREGFGLFPLEAMAAGLPVVYCSSPESAVSELVRDGVDGIQTAAEPGALAAALGDLMDDPERRARMGAAARDRAMGLDWGEIAREIESVLTDRLRR